MSKKVVVIDYGMGNLRSVSKAVEYVSESDDSVIVTDDPKQILGADRVVFPGQGAARECMLAISEHHLNHAVLEAASSKPFLGICMGLQVLMSFSEENGGTDLLSILDGQVRRFPTAADKDSAPLKIPHMGWNTVRQTQQHPLWRGVPDESRFYFVHSYYVEPVDRDLTIGITDYGLPFTSTIATGNLFATQFHPEKSADVGLQLLKNFVNWEI